MPWGGPAWGGVAWGQSKGLSSFTRATSDSWSVSDSVARAFAGSRATADSWSVSDTRSKVSVFAVDTVGVSDSVSGALHQSRATNDSWSVSDIAQRGFSRTAADSFSISDAVARSAIVYSRSAADSVSVTDSIGRTIHFSRATTDSYSVSDAVTYRVGKTLFDSFSVTDHSTATIVLGRSASDSWSVMDSVGTRVPIHFNRVAFDVWTITDRITDHTINISDNIGLITDSVNPNNTPFTRNFFEFWAVSDTTSLTGAHMTRRVTDSVVFSDSAIWITGIVRNAFDSWTVSDVAISIKMTPHMRQLWRIAVGRERGAPQYQMGNGSLFVLLPGSPTHGSFAYGNSAWTQDLSEANSDGGILTWDLNLAGAIRSTGLFSETPQ